MYRQIVKPTIDTSLAVILLIISSPLLLLTIVFLFIANSGKVFFIQARPGKEEKIFNLIKFRTMNDKKDEKGNPLPDKDRLTTVGKVVRKLSIDELPQLFNVIKGDMSLIGPRPWLVEYLPLYNDFQRRRHEVKPGITGWAQVNGRNALSWERRFDYDIYYVDYISFALDIKIFFLTIYNIILGRGISGEGSATMEKFRGIL
jgi:lipopolysaccharide/colanic/teichoic acid biosynthesis glycosyltransferase